MRSNRSLLAAGLVLAVVMFGLAGSQVGRFTGWNLQTSTMGAAAPGVPSLPIKGKGVHIPGSGDAYKHHPARPVDLSVPRGAGSPDHLTHPCGGHFAEPPFMGLSPLSLAWSPNNCSGSGYGDIAAYQAVGHDYVVLSGFDSSMFFIWRVDDPYNPQLIATQLHPAGGFTGTSVFTFKQGSSEFVSVTERGSGTGCGFFIYNVDNPSSPQFVARKAGTDWCSPHEHFVSTDTNGNADYAWLAMGGEFGSAYKVVALDIRSLPTVTETGRYQRPDAHGNNYVHDVTVIGNRVFLAHWEGGAIIHDKATLASSTNPTPLNPINSIRPSNFWVHHSWPTSDGNHLFVEDEFLNSSNVEKVKLYNISDISNPYYEGGIIGTGTAATSQAHNLKIKPIAPGRDLLLVAWYEAGTRGFEVDLTGSTPVISPTILHQVLQSPGAGFNNAWGVDFLPCTLRGQAHTCLYTGDLLYGLIVDALGQDPSLDPYKPESAITSPTSGQTITTCSVTIQGNAHDYYSGLTGVEVSTDGGNTWNPAQGTANWTYAWNITANGQYVLKSRARDTAGNVEVPTLQVTVNVTAGCGGEPTATSTPVPPTSTPTATSTAVPATATSTQTPCSIAFSDVLPTDYFYEPVRYLFCAGAISGYDDNTFRPYNDTTRGQLTKIVVLAEGWPIDLTGAPHFSDVTAGNPFYEFIETAYNRGVISGYADGTFRWGTNVTRGQLAKIVVEAEEWAIDTSGGPHFTDVPQTDPFYEYIETAYNREVITGYADGTFRPGNPATRGQIAKIVFSAVTAP